MKRRLLVPCEGPDGAYVAAHFGRAPYFVTFDLDESGAVIEKSVHPNTGEHAGGKGHAHNNVLRLMPNVVIVQGMGPRGLSSFQSKDIAVLHANSNLIDNLVAAYIRNELQELTEGCSQAHHK
ncbi:MAG: NifB/NifX family molybdenum-iron cluster-binding protein [Candidatus Thorarchaeota archaeon]|jgi:predicted Fe-Mo cluster-binding NifX family protein